MAKPLGGVLMVVSDCAALCNPIAANDPFGLKLDEDSVTKSN